MKLEGVAKFLFFTMMQSAIKMKELGKTQKDFEEFAKEIWVSMEMSDIEDLKEALELGMMSDLQDYLK